MFKVVYIISDIDKALAFEWIALNIDKKFITISFILLNSGDSHLEFFLKEHNISVTRIKCRGKKDWLVAWMKIIKYLNEYKPEVIHCHLLTASILGLSAAKFSGVKKRIYTRHHSDFHFRYFPKGIKWDKLCNNLATKIIAPSGTVKKVLIEMEGVPESKIELIHHGFDLEYFKNVPKDVKDLLQLKYNPAVKKPVIGVISRFTELKGIQYIIPAFEKILKEYPDALLLLFNAKGDFNQQIRNLLSKLPVASYHTVDFEKELAGVYSLFEVFVQVSTDTNIEAFGQTYVEALASGIPSVFTLSGIAPDFIINEENAIVVPFKDSDAIYQGILRIIGDKEFANLLIENGENIVNKIFKLKKMIYNLQNSYQK